MVLDHRDKSTFATREDYDRELARQLKARGVRLVCLAGFMRLLTQSFLDDFPDAVVNIHPSLLPAFPGTNAQYQAWAHGVKWTGATVHLVTAELDGGPIVLQETVPVKDGDDADVLAARILEREHHLYPLAIQMLLNGGWRIEGPTVPGKLVPNGTVVRASPRQCGGYDSEPNGRPILRTAVARPRL